MRAITLWQPWAWAIAHAGKDVENRTWAPPRTVLGQRIAIHAGKRIARGAFPWPDGVASPPDRTVTSAIVAVTRVAGSLRPGELFSPTRTPEIWWLPEQFGWLLAGTVALAEPIRCGGHQGVWTLSREIEDAVGRQILGIDGDP